MRARLDRDNKTFDSTKMILAHLAAISGRIGVNRRRGTAESVAL